MYVQYVLPQCACATKVRLRVVSLAYDALHLTSTLTTVSYRRYIEVQCMSTPQVDYIVVYTLHECGITCERFSIGPYGVCHLGFSHPV